MFCLLHGFGVGQRYFDPLAAELGGEQVRPLFREPLSIAELADRVGELLPGPAVVVGNSMGCQVATELALRRPELVEGLVLIGPTVDPSARSLLRQGARLALDAWFEHPRLTGIVLRDYLRFGPAHIWRQARYVLADAIEARLGALDMPALIIRGAHDPVCPAAWGQEAARLLRTQMVTIAGAAHAAHFSHPRQVAAEIRRLPVRESAAPHG